MGETQEITASHLWKDDPAEYLEMERQYPSIALHSCWHCRKLVLDIRQTAESLVDRGNYLWIIKSTPTGFTFGDALQAREEGCALFAKLVEDNLTPLKAKAGSILWDRSSLANPDDLKREILYSMNMDPEPHLTFRLALSNSPWQAEIMQFYFLHPLIGIEPIYPFLDRNLPPNLALGSPLAFRQAQAWLDTCCASHDKCRAAKKTFTPRRLISVGTIEDPKLRLVDDSVGQPYIALSYCWGGDQPGKTTKDNVQSYLHSINPHSLPQTILDAAIVARGIAYPYLWIDALCIVQDDQEDKALQIAQMHDVYRSADLVIAATCASKSTDGFLYPRQRFRPVEVKVITEDDCTGHMLLSPSHLFHTDHRFHERGWIFQEQVLSTRSLIFDDGRMGFECLEATWEYSHRVDADVLGSLYHAILNQCLQSDHPDGWSLIVWHYSRRVVGEPQDRLNALAAVATRYAEEFVLDEFLSGMWRAEFLSQLTWSPDKQFLEDKPLIDHWRPTEYIAPSWSWASLFGPVSMSPSPASGETRHFTCTLLDAKTTPVSLALPFGPVTDGHIVIRGRVVRVVWLNYDVRTKGYGDIDNLRVRQWGNGPDPYRCTSPDDDYIWGFHLSIDLLSEWTGQPEVPVLFLEIYTKRTAMEHTSRGLILYPVNEEANDSRYRRIGTADVDRSRSYLRDYHRKRLAKHIPAIQDVPHFVRETITIV